MPTLVIVRRPRTARSVTQTVRMRFLVGTSVADVADEERPPELPWISISPEIMSHAVWLYHRFGVRFRDAADLLAQHGLTVSDDAIRLWCLDFDSADARRLTRRQGRLGDIWHRDKVFVR